MEKKTINPTLHGTYVGVHLTKDQYLKTEKIEFNDDQLREARNKKITSGDAFVVTVVGEQVSFVKPGDIVHLIGNTRASEYNIYNNVNEPLIVFREAEIALKL